MKGLLSVAATIAAAFGLVAAVVFAAADRALFVPPPEAAAEEFTRQLATKRFDLARQRLSKEARSQITADTLRDEFEAVRARTGKINTVDAAQLSMDDTQAMATTVVEGDEGAATLMVKLSREKGLWMVDGYVIAATREGSRR